MNSDVLYYVYQFADARTRHIIAVRLSRAMRSRIHVYDTNVTVITTSSFADFGGVRFEYWPILDIHIPGRMISLSVCFIQLTNGPVYRGNTIINFDNPNSVDARLISVLPKYLLLHYNALLELAYKDNVFH